MPLAEYKDNLVAMVTAARQAGVQNVLLITPPPIDEAAWAKEVRDGCCCCFACRLKHTVAAAA